jgi:hypothetical protein
MCVYKNHAFICFGRPPSWSGTIIMHIYNRYHSITTSIHLCIRTQIICTGHFSPLLIISLASCFLLFSFCPMRPLLLTWNPPCCDRIRLPCPQVARKLTLPFPSPGSYTPHSKIPTPRSFPTPNIHSLGQQCESSSQDRAQQGLRGLSWNCQV